MKSTRTSWQVTRSVWHALFLREMIGRTMANRYAWFWMIVEPVAMISIMVAIRSVISSGNLIAGAEYIPWIITGLFGFFLFRENMLRALGAIQANKALFAYRQVKTVDPVFIRCFIEGIIRTFVFILFIAGANLIGIISLPDYPLHTIGSWLAIWFLGVGAALTFSALSTLVPEIGKIIRLSSLPLLIISGAMFPVHHAPYEIQQILLFNPILHSLELLRSSFFENYRMLDNTSALYLAFWALTLNTLGLLLHLRFADRLKVL